MKLQGQVAEGGEIDIKRFYIPGVKLVGKCPSCGKKYVCDFAQRYLSNPNVGANVHTCWCEHCDHEWDVTLKLSLTLSLET